MSDRTGTGVSPRNRVADIIAREMECKRGVAYGVAETIEEEGIVLNYVNDHNAMLDALAKAVEHGIALEKVAQAALRAHACGYGAEAVGDTFECYACGAGCGSTDTMVHEDTCGWVELDRALMAAGCLR